MAEPHVFLHGRTRRSRTRSRQRVHFAYETRLPPANLSACGREFLTAGAPANKVVGRRPRLHEGSTPEGRTFLAECDPAHRKISHLSGILSIRVRALLPRNPWHKGGEVGLAQDALPRRLIRSFESRTQSGSLTARPRSAASFVKRS